MLQHCTNLHLEDLADELLKALGLLLNTDDKVVRAVAEVAGDSGFFGFVHAAQHLKLVGEQALHCRDLGRVQHGDSGADDVFDVVPRVGVEQLTVASFAGFFLQRGPGLYSCIYAVEIHAGIAHEFMEGVAEGHRHVLVCVYPSEVGGAETCDCVVSFLVSLGRLF